MSLAAHVEAKIGRRDGGCWLWTGKVDHGGYGGTRVAGRYKVVHRYVYETLVGPIPDGLDLDHLCRVRACCNPTHLEPVTRAENIHRSPFTWASINAAKTHCVHGHEFTFENTYTGRGRRECRACSRAWLIAFHARNAREVA